MLMVRFRAIKYYLKTRRQGWETWNSGSSSPFHLWEVFIISNAYSAPCYQTTKTLSLCLEWRRVHTNHVGLKIKKDLAGFVVPVVMFQSLTLSTRHSASFCLWQFTVVFTTACLDSNIERPIIHFDEAITIWQKGDNVFALSHLS